MKKDKIKAKRKSLAVLAEDALKKAVAQVIIDHQRTGDPVAILQEGKVVSIPADQIRVSEPKVEYKARMKISIRSSNRKKK